MNIREFNRITRAFYLDRYYYVDIDELLEDEEGVHWVYVQDKTEGRKSRVWWNNSFLDTAKFSQMLFHTCRIWMNEEGNVYV